MNDWEEKWFEFMIKITCILLIIFSIWLMASASGYGVITQCQHCIKSEV